MSSPLLIPECPAQSVGAFNTMVNTFLQTLLIAQCAISTPYVWPSDYAEEFAKNEENTYDFVVVGAGSAGSVIASRLSENPNWKVLVLEAGDDPPLESEVPAFFFTLQHTNATWNYFTEYSDKACLGTTDGRCYWPRGKMIGGSGGANGMLYVRGNRKDFDNWDQAGNSGWGWDDVLPYFDRATQPVGNETHPQGYVILNQFPVHDENIEQMIYQGAHELGIPRIRQFTDDNDIGYANLPGTIQNGRRMSTGKSHLSKVSKRSNLKVIKNAHVTKLNFDESGKHVDSVSFVIRNKKEMTVSVGKEVVLSAGAIDSPKLLMLSGVGRAQHLNDLKIPLVHDLPVGDNLQDHINVLTFFKLNEHEAHAWQMLDTLDRTYEYLIHQKGPLSSNGVLSLTGFFNTLGNSQYPDVQFMHIIFRRGDFNGLKIYLNALNMSERLKESILKNLETADILCNFNILLNPKSIGNVSLRSADYSDPPKIAGNYLSQPEDLATLRRAIRFQEKLLNTEAYEEMGAILILPPIDECSAHVPRSEGYWRCYIKYFSFTTYHPVGTVKMAPETDVTSCVNSRLRLAGCDNVRVADASIMPIIPSANTNAATIMIGEKAADFIREDWQDKKFEERRNREKEDIMLKAMEMMLESRFY